MLTYLWRPVEVSDKKRYMPSGHSHHAAYREIKMLNVINIFLITQFPDEFLVTGHNCYEFLTFDVTCPLELPQSEYTHLPIYLEAIFVISSNGFIIMQAT